MILNNNVTMKIDWIYGNTKPNADGLFKQGCFGSPFRWFKLPNGENSPICRKEYDDGYNILYEGDIYNDRKEWEKEDRYAIVCIGYGRCGECNKKVGNIYETPELIEKQYFSGGYENWYVDGKIVNAMADDCYPRLVGFSKEEYKTYINSHLWKRIKAKVIKRDNCKCVICGCNDKALHVHHLSYERFTAEDTSDLVTLCPDCHDLIHTISDKAIYLASKRPFWERYYQPNRNNPLWRCKFIYDACLEHNPQFHWDWGKDNRIQAGRFIAICILTTMGHPFDEDDLVYSPKNKDLYIMEFNETFKNIRDYFIYN